MKLISVLHSGVIYNSCVKSAELRGFFGMYLPVFALQISIFSLSTGNYGPQKAPDLDMQFMFSRVVTIHFCLRSQLIIARSAPYPCRSSHRRCSVKIGVLKILQILQKNTCVGVSF